MSKISPELVSDLISYDKNNGNMVWKKRSINHFLHLKEEKRKQTCDWWNKRFSGLAIKRKNREGYNTVKINGKQYQSSHIAWVISYGKWPLFLDHKNRIRDDDRLENLREVDHSTNCRNRGIRSDNTNGYPGVYKEGNKFSSYLTVDSKRIRLGLFETVDEAIDARKEREKYYGYGN